MQSTILDLELSFSVIRIDSMMYGLIAYVWCAIVYIFLYWFQKPKIPQEANNNQQQNSNSNNNSLDKDYSPSMTSQKSTLARLMSFRRRRGFSEKDIAIKLGLKPDASGFEAFYDKFGSIEVVGRALVEAGFQTCDVIIGIDFTASNEWQGRRSFSRHSLHKVSGSKIYNPYQKVLNIIGKTLSFICKDHNIYIYGFGDSVTKDREIFELCPGGTTSQHYQKVIESYTNAAKSVELSGPTNLSPLIRHAVRRCIETNEYHILIMIVDGQVSAKSEQETVDAIVDASRYPLSIIAIGIGDGPFGSMFEYDDGLPRRKFDNFQFVNFHRTVTSSKHEAAFALHSLMEIPDQYKACHQLGYLNVKKKTS